MAPSLGQAGVLRHSLSRLARAQSEAMLALNFKNNFETAQAKFGKMIDEVEKAYEAYKPMITPDTDEEVLMGDFGQALAGVQGAFARHHATRGFR